MGDNEDRISLEKFVFPNPDLEKFESLIGNFNLFEAVGMSTQEIRHSATLAFFLGPNNSHGLGEYFLKRVLKKIAQNNPEKLSPIEIDYANFSDVEVRREWKHIDILVISKSSNLVVAIENKIFASESEKQLSKYVEVIKNEFPDYKKILVYLTIAGKDPVKKKDQENWLNFSHEEIVEELQNSLEFKKNDIGGDQEVLLRHYIDLMRRRVLSNSEIAVLARKLYNAHKQAIDLIIEHKNDFQAEVKEYLLAKVEKSGLETDRSPKHLVRFYSEKWEYGKTWRADNWGSENRGVLFEISIHPECLELSLIVGKMPDERKEVLSIEISTQLGRTCPELVAWTQIWHFGEELYLEPIAKDKYWEAQVDTWWSKFLSEDKNRVCSAVDTALSNLGVRDDL